MRILCLVALLTFTSAVTRHRRIQRQQNKNWDIRLAVPGEPGSDYPTLGNIPRTSFSCSGREPGYYADVETNCQAFRVCTRGTTFGFQSFLCPNGTLFNQAVFVCDWWMNVNCDKSQELVNKNSARFENLQLGPQLMKDIKKMITFPMLNPYDKNMMRSNLIVMQSYVPPKGQMPMNAELVNDFNSNIDNNYYQKKQNIIQSFGNNDISFAASTPSSQYIPAASYNRPQSPRNDAEVFQRQSQSAQYQKQSQVPHYNHAGKLIQLNSNDAQLLTAPKSYQRNIQFQTNFAQYVPPYQQGNNNNQLTNNPQQSNFVASKEFDMDFPMQYAPYPNFAPDISNSKGGNELKQNLVSNNVSPSPVLAKSFTFNKYIQPKMGSPRSRITFKTWIVKPSREKLIRGPYSPPDESIDNSEIQEKPNSFQQIIKANLKNGKISLESNANTQNDYDTQQYQYERPAQPYQENIRESSPYFYNKPSAAPLQATQTGQYIYNKPTAAPLRVTQAGPYMYNKPTSAPQRDSEPVPYVYNKPTLPPRQISTQPTSPKPTLSGRLYLPPSSVAPTQPARLYVPPITTYKPAVKLYLPPSSSSQPIILSNQYLPPQNEKLRASPSTPTPLFTQPNNINTESPSFSLTKHSRINANHNNFTFADILTKEKLDITVNDIVKSTKNVLDKTINEKSSQYTQEEKYLPPGEGNSAEILTPASITNPIKNAKIVQSPSVSLEPPIENPEHNNNNNNAISKLPFYYNPTNPTIERTVSLKISIPEKIASTLFNNDSKIDTLEILNTGSSNYLVLANNQIHNANSNTFIPIAKLVEDKQPNNSNSQALVYKILQDSLSVAKEYSNIAHQSVLTTRAPFQNVSGEDYARIVNQISQLTAQHTRNDFQSTIQMSPENSRHTQQFQDQYNTVPSQNTQQNSITPQLKNQIYSGQYYQLTVPDVTNQLNTAQKQTDENARTASDLDYPQPFYNTKEDTPDFEIIKSQTIPVSVSNNLQEEEITNEDINANAIIQSLLNSVNGLSAQVEDKIVGTIPHPSQRNKLVTYKKDKSYYVVAHNNLNDQNKEPVHYQNAKLVQNSPEDVEYQFLPSVGIELRDEKEQNNILNTFKIDQNGQPKNLKSQRLTQDINLKVEHPLPLYSGPSSYSAPQASVGRLENKPNDSRISRIEQFESNTEDYGYD